jgi:selenocysteine-specific elongation factor
MVAGATGLDLVCLVIAADEGVMPQTREHLDICELLGVRRGLVALTKRDLVDDEWLAMVTADVRTEVAGTFLADAPIVACSTRSGAGLDELRAAIATAVDQVPPREHRRVCMPIDRPFTVKGFGTIATGTVLGGAVTIGDELRRLPSRAHRAGPRRRVHGAAVERGRRPPPRSTSAASRSTTWRAATCSPICAASHIVDRAALPRDRARAAGPHGPGARSPRHRAGAHDAGGRSRRARARRHRAGQPGSRQPRRSPRCPASSRGSSPPRPTARRSAAVASSVPPSRCPGLGARRHRARLAAARQDRRLALDVKTAAFAGLGVTDLIRRTGISGEVLAPALATLVAGGELLVIGAADHAHYFHAAAVAEIEARIVRAVAAAPEGVLREELRTQLPSALPVRAYADRRRSRARRSPRRRSRRQRPGPRHHAVGRRDQARRIAAAGRSSRRAPGPPGELGLAGRPSRPCSIA